MSSAAVTQRSNAKTALIMAAIVLAMLGLAFASVPLYRIFCAATGFNGTPQRASDAPGAVAGQIGVRFDANIDGKLPWTVRPEKNVISIAPGAKTQINFIAENLSDHEVTGRAVFNVSPDLVGKYFNKIACFCFTEQTLKPHEKVDMPVVFFVDPKMMDDEDANFVKEITLSYTFYPVESGGQGR